MNSTEQTRLSIEIAGHAGQLAGTADRLRRNNAKTADAADVIEACDDASKDLAECAVRLLSPPAPPETTPEGTQSST